MTREEQREIVLNKWQELIDELSIYLMHSIKAGGKLGQKVGNVRDKQKRLKEFFENYA